MMFRTKTFWIDHSPLLKMFLKNHNKSYMKTNKLVIDPNFFILKKKLKKYYY